MSSDQRLIVALDVHSMESVRQLVGQLGDSVSYYKVGMELFYSVGSQVITYLRQQNKDIFLDLKLHDIPNTVGQGLATLTQLGATMLNVHAAGGFSMMQAAAIAVKNKAIEIQARRPKLIAVTVLTSMNENEWSGIGYNVDLSQQVIHLSKLAQKAGMDGVVASPQEAAQIQKACGSEFIVVTPGIRPNGAAINDQSRIATPAGALKNGAHHLVIGRPITAAANPRQAVKDILREMRDLA
ncbi:orotidine-5'-phosphate decarboxylase [Pelosinus propionicus]|uniref:Orotidine 5'-phosphate decarboxylase n=1 Tax=Pelosinus propionicus DSM 13327 TaxID=1123291 RepID=A0A1I4LKZ9_9FIRM|nr:orotidine-5'-phosphate decarboxylase [Pelosinus propionicus]SFL91778.1 orotidine-5'-phosphate decarboxylase [Pelosinus propionicus DSM 13327]